jgi:hypothetical protein
MIPVTLFICVTYAIKAIVEARMRGKLLSSGGSEDLVRTLMQNEEEQRRHAALRWGILLLSLALGFSLIEAFGWDQVTPGVIAILLAVTGVGNLVSYTVSRRLK